jgi:hypothetical protein
VVLWGIGALTAALLSLPISWFAYGGLALAILFLLIYVVASTLAGKAASFLLAWLVISPLGYYYLSYPREKPLFTFDRAVIPLLAVAACCALSSENRLAIPGPLRRAGVAWGTFLLAATLSLVKISGGPGLFSGLRVLLDAFLLPAVLGWYVISVFPVRRHLKMIHLLVCLTTFYLAPMGVIEFFSGKDLLPLPSAGLYFAGSGESMFLRANGPFASSNSYSLIGLMMLCLLLFLRHALPGDAMPWWQRALHWIGLVCALVVSLLSLHRSIMITLVLILFLQIWFAQSATRRVVLVAALLALAGMFAAGSFLLPALYEERVWNDSNVSARMAQQRQTLGMFSSNPVLGVGLNNFISAAPQATPYTGRYSGVDPLDAPHSNLGAILAETGVVGFVPYLAANGLLVAAFWKLRVDGMRRPAWIWKIFVYVFLSYWVTGLSVTSGHYGDLNLWYLFVVACLYKYGMTETVDVPRDNRLAGVIQQ